MNYRFVSNITFKSNTYEGEQEYNPPLKFDNNNYQYFIKILNVRFSNNVANVSQALELVNNDGLTIATVQPGIYEINDLIKLVNEQTTGIVEFKINEFNGKMIAKNLMLDDLYLKGSLFNSIQFGKFENNTHFNPDQSIESPEVCSVSDSNYFKLCSNIIGPSSYETSRDGRLVTTNTLYTFAATIAKFGHKDFCAFQDIAYPLNMDQLQNIDFELLDEHGNTLKLLPGATSDFNIQAVIVKSPKDVKTF